MGHELRIAAGVVLKSEEQSEDKNGWRTTYTFSGTKAECDAQRVIERVRGAKTIMLRSLGDGNHELVSTYPFDADGGGNGDGDEPTDTHELEVSMAQQDVFTNPKLVAAINEAGRHVLRDLVQRYKRGKFATAADAQAQAVIEAAGEADIPTYFNLIALKGVEHWIFYRCVYSRSITLATTRQLQASFEGTQKLWTTAQLLAWENLPNDWWFQLPGGTVWHKSIPTVTTNIGRASKTQIQYKYIGSDEASTLLYDAY